MRRLIPALALGPALVLGTLGSSTAHGAVLTVPTQYSTLADAIAAASPTDRIELLSGTYEVEVVVDKALRIQPVTGATVVFTNTTGTAGQMIDVVSPATSIEIRNIRFDGGGNPDVRGMRTTDVGVVQLIDCSATGLHSSGDGGVLEANNALVVNIDTFDGDDLSAANGGLAAVKHTNAAQGTSMTLRNAMVSNTSAALNGGAVFSQNAGVTVVDSSILVSSAENGGALWGSQDETLGNGRDLKLQRSMVEDATATELGGAVYGQAVSVIIDNANLVRNSAGSGGAIWMDELSRIEELVISNVSLFDENLATGGGTGAGAEGAGAAIFAKASSLVIRDAMIQNSMGISGTTSLEGNTLTVTDAAFTNNLVDGDGGALIASVGTASFVRTMVDLNAAGSLGGGLKITADSLSVDASEFTFNDALGAGGAIWVDGAALDFDDTRFTDNSADLGGAVFSTATDRSVLAEDSVFFRNLATVGGGVHATGVSTLSSTRNAWCGNVATTGNGGALAATGTGAFTVRNDGAASNMANNGGVYQIDGFTHADMAFSTYAGNEGTAGAVLNATGFTLPSTLRNVAATSSVGTAFSAVDTQVPMADFVGFLDNGSDFGGDWAATVPTHPVTIPTGVPLYTNFPAATCEALSLKPHPSVGNPLIDVGPLMTDRDNSLNDVGLSGGAAANPALFLDGDGDGFVDLNDCDDTRADANPAATDFCNGIDDNCNGTVDENPDTLWFADADGDTFGDPTHPLDYPAQCDPPEPGAAGNDDDCDDTQNAINPDAIEVCDTIDNNCDLVTDTDATDRTAWFRDVDFDGYGVDTNTVLSCDQPVGYVDQPGDCNDTLANIYPGAEERCDTLDNDCNGVIDNDGVNAPRWYPDFDQDGVGTGVAVVSCLPPLDHSPYTGDCDDTDSRRTPGNAEICDGIDNDCDDEIDVDPITPTYLPDVDLDGYGDAEATPIGSCTVIPGLVTNADDCNDHDAAINPDSDEQCDGIDEDCDGQIDNSPTNGTIYYLDSDGDSFGTATFEIRACSLPAIGSEVAGDCNDNNDDIFPGNVEVCDFLDNDCDGDVDEDDAADATVWYQDADGDGYGTETITVLACRPPVRHVSVAGDCDDANPVAFPGRLEVCDGVDNDCNGTTDGADASDVRYFFRDADGDGFGDAGEELGACSIPEGYVSNSTDCDDNDGLVFPGAQEIFGNSIDEDCDGQTPGETDTGIEPPDPKPCGCSSGAAGGAPWLLLMPLAALLRRRK